MTDVSTLSTTPPPSQGAGDFNPGNALPAVRSTGATNNPTSTSLQTATRAAPQLDPKTILAVATSAASPADAAQRAQIVHIFDTATKVGQQLSDAPARAQLAYWNTAPKPMRDLLQAAGYSPPDAPSPTPPQPGGGGGLLSSVWHDVAHQFDNVRHAGAAGAAWTLHEPLHYAGDVVGVGVDQLLHGMRTALQVADQNDLRYQTGQTSLAGDIQALFDGHSWVQAWHQTQNGAAVYQPQVVRLLQKQLTPQQLELAKLMAGGASLQQVLQKVPQAQRGAIYDYVQTDDTFKQAVQLLSDSHLTLGQAVFGGLSAQQEAKLFPNAHGIGAYHMAGGALGGALVGGMRGGLTGAALGAVGGAAAEAAANQLGTTPDQAMQVNPFGLKVHPLSGLVDGIVSWYDSPFIIGQETHAASLARRFSVLDGLGNARDVRALYQTDPAVARGMDRIASALTRDPAGGISETANIARLQQTFPQLNAMADDFSAHYDQIAQAVRDGRGGEEVANLFASKQALINLARGRAGLFFHRETLFPHLTAGGALAQRLKMGTADLIARASGQNLDKISPGEWTRAVAGNEVARQAIAEATRARGLAPRVARFARRATTLTPLKDFIDLSDPDRAAVFQRYAEMFLPRSEADRLTNAFMAVPVTEQGRQIKMIHALQDELFIAAGLDESLAGQRYIEDWKRERDLGTAGEHYSFGQNAFYRSPSSDAEAGREHAILPSQLSNAIAMPRFSDLYKLAKKSWAMQALGAVLDAHTLDRFMTYWKAALLARPGFALRVAGEELFGTALREGMFSVAQARVAASMLGIESPVTPALRRALPRLLEALTGHVPGEALRAIETPEDLDAAIYGWRAVHAFRKAGLRFVPQDVLDAAKWRAIHGEFRGPLAESIDALTQHSGGIVDDEHGWTEATRLWDGAEPIRMVPTGKMARVGRLDEDAFPAYHYALSGIAADTPGRSAAAALDAGHDQQVADVLAWLNDPANRALVDRFAVAHMTPDGREVAAGEATGEEALQAWAERIVAHVDHYLRSAHDGTPIRLGDGSLLAEHVARGEVPPTTALEEVDRRHLPDEIVARELLPKLEGGLQRLLERGMQQMVGRPLNYLSRMPVYHLHFSTAFRETRAMLESLGIHDDGDMLAGDIASERAWRETLPYIHNPRVRSQMSMITRNLAPFWFAQEQFLKRWARTFATYPEAFRKAQLLMNGLRSVGFVQKDQYGQDAFVYPGSGFVTSALAKVFPGASLPVLNSFTGEIAQLNPSFSGLFPSVGPVVSIPLSVLNAYMPELDPVTQALLGPSAPKENHEQAIPVQAMLAAVDQTMPSIVQRAIQAFSSTAPTDPTYSSTLANAVVEAAQYLEASGHGLPEHASPAQVDPFQQRLTNWARTMMGLRAVFGFFAPASPSFSIQGTELGRELDALMATMPYDQAVAAFVKAHPDATPYTVFATTTGNVGQSGAYIPTTQAALDFIDEHKAVFADPKYSAAAPWLLPLSTGKGPFSDAAYLAELSTGLRARRDIPTVIEQVRYAEGANIYFPAEAKVKELEAANPGYKQQIQHVWDTWAASFKRANPIFATLLDEPTATTRRTEVVQSLQQMIADDKLPDTLQARHLAFLMAGFARVQDYYEQTIGSAAYSAQRAENKAAFLRWSSDVAAEWPDVAPFVSDVLSRVVPG